MQRLQSLYDNSLSKNVQAFIKFDTFISTTIQHYSVYKVLHKNYMYLHTFFCFCFLKQNRLKSTRIYKLFWSKMTSLCMTLRGQGVDCVKEYVAKYKQLKRTMYCVGWWYGKGERGGTYIVSAPHACMYGRPLEKQSCYVSKVFGYYNYVTSLLWNAELEKELILE